MTMPLLIVQLVQAGLQKRADRNQEQVKSVMKGVLLEKSRGFFTTARSGNSRQTHWQPEKLDGDRIFADIEDGDLNIPSCYMSEEEGRCLAQYTMQQITPDRNSNGMQRAEHSSQCSNLADCLPHLTGKLPKFRCVAYLFCTWTGQPHL